MGQYETPLEHLRKALTIRWEALPEDHPDLAKTYGSLGSDYAKNGDLEQAKQAFEEYERLFPNRGETYRNWALYHALRGEDEKVLVSLQKAVELGYDNLRWIEKEEAFEGLRETEAYKELIRELRVKNEGASHQGGHTIIFLLIISNLIF